MNNKLIAYGATCFGLGALVGWAITADHNEKQSKLESEAFRQTVDAQRRFYTEEIDKLESKPVSFIQNTYTTPDGEERIDGVQYDDDHPELDYTGSDDSGVKIVIPIEEIIPEGETEVETRSKLQSIVEQYAGSPQDRAVFVDTAFESVELDRKNAQPFVISREQYASFDPEDEGNDYAKITLTWYPAQQILLDDDDEVITQPEIPSKVGHASLRQFGGISGDPDVVFVRNRREYSDYEVVQDTDNEPPIHVRYGMGKEEFRAAKASGALRFDAGSG